MIKLFINSSDQSDYLDDGSLSIIDQIQNKANTAYFSLLPGGTAPSENQEVLIYDTATVVSASGTAVVLTDTLSSGISILTYGKFRVGEYIFLSVGEADEERLTISAIVAGAAGQVNITTVETITGTHANTQGGKLIFGGTLTYVKKSNPKLLTTVEYQCNATDFTKIFDKKNINDSWADVDARYIINDALNTTINYNKELDDMDYADNAAIQAEWIESGDGTNPTVDTSDFIQGTSSGVLNWTNSGGTATFSATPTSTDTSDLIGASSGAPMKGNVSFWYKRTSAAGMTTMTIRVGSDSSNYTAVSFTPITDTDWHFKSLSLPAGTETGTPVWTAVDYLAVIVAESTSSSIRIDDIRLTADGSFTMYNFEETTDFDDVRASFKKPTVFIDRLADTLSQYWYIDYERDIHFFDRETNEAPYSITSTSDNFSDLVVDIDTAQLKNRQVIRGGTKPSDSLYTQVVEGDLAVREWILKSKFENMTIKLDNNTSTDTCEAGTNTTTINATAHGLATGDYIVNRSRSNAVRKITVVTANQFTVEAVTSQTNGDTFSKFATTQTDGVEFLVDETTVNYVTNFNEKSVRATAGTATLNTGEFLLFSYNEIIPIRVSVQDNASIVSIKAIIGGDGIFEGAVISDSSLDSTQAARDRGQAEVNQWANPIVKISFKTDYEGLSSGQLIRVTDSGKSIDDDYIIQQVKIKYKARDFPQFEVQCASSLFGIIEYFQKLSQATDEQRVDEDEQIDLITSETAEITITEVNTFTATENADETATITVTETSNTATERTPASDPYQWQPDASSTKWNLFSWM